MSPPGRGLNRTGYLLDQFHLVAVRVFEEGDHAASVLHRPGLAGDPIAQRPGPGAGDGGILDLDGQVAVAVALGVAVPVPVVGQLQGSGRALVLVADEGQGEAASG